MLTVNAFIKMDTQISILVSAFSSLEYIPQRGVTGIYDNLKKFFEELFISVSYAVVLARAP